MLFNPTKFVCLEEIREVVQFVNRTIEKELTMQQLSDFAKWDFHFVEDITDEIDITVDFNRALKIVVEEYPELDFNHWRASGKITYDGEGIWFSDGNSWQLDEALDDDTAQPLYDELTNHVNFDSVFDATQDIAIVDLEDYYDHVISAVVDEFNIELDFSFLATKVAQELTEKQIITILKDINSISKTGAERVHLYDLRQKYKKSRTYLELSFLLDDEPDIVEVLRIAEMTHPVNIDGEIVESKDFVWLTGDGRHNNRGCNIEYDPNTKRLYKENWSQWQGEGRYYDKITLQNFLEIIKNTHDVAHTRRHVKGLKQYLEAISN